MLCMLLLLAGLAGCSKSSDDFTALLDGTLALDSITDTQKNAFIKEGKKRGCVVTFDDELTISDKNGGVVLRQTTGDIPPDEAGDERLTTGSGWPDNEFTQQIPNPWTEGMEAAWHMEEKHFTVVELKRMDKAAAKAYAKQLNKAGVDGDVYIECGYEMSLQMKDEAGDTVEFFWSEEKGAASHPSVVVCRGRKDAEYAVEFFWANGSAELRVRRVLPGSYPMSFGAVLLFMLLFAAWFVVPGLLVWLIFRGLTCLKWPLPKNRKQNMQIPPGTYPETHRYI